MEHLPDEACISLVAAKHQPVRMSSSHTGAPAAPNSQQLDLLAEDLPAFQRWMTAFQTLLAGEPDERVHSRRISVPLDEQHGVEPMSSGSEEAEWPAPRVQLSTVPRELETNTMLQIANHWTLLQARGQASPDISSVAAAGASAGIQVTALADPNELLGQWCLRLMREGVRVQHFRHREASTPEPVRSFLSCLLYTSPSPRD